MSHQYLETSFWNDDHNNGGDLVNFSDDEGIGSDDSVDQNDHSQCTCDSKREGNNTKMTQTVKSESLSVTKFLKVLKQSVRRDPRSSGDISVKSHRHHHQPPAEVFGVDLVQHLTSSRSSVPGVVREDVRLYHFVFISHPMMIILISC